MPAQPHSVGRRNKRAVALTSCAFACVFARPQCLDQTTEAECKAALDGERANVALARHCVRELGGVPSMLAPFDSTDRPEEKVTNFVGNFVCRAHSLLCYECDVMQLPCCGVCDEVVHAVLWYAAQWGAVGLVAAPRHVTRLTLPFTMVYVTRPWADFPWSISPQLNWFRCQKSSALEPSCRKLSEVVSFGISTLLVVG